MVENSYRQRLTLSNECFTVILRYSAFYFSFFNITIVATTMQDFRDASYYYMGTYSCTTSLNNICRAQNIHMCTVFIGALTAKYINIILLQEKNFYLWAALILACSIVRHSPTFHYPLPQVACNCY